MRVKLLLIALLLVSLCIVSSQAMVSPMAPKFEEAKKLAMTSAPDEDGDYVFGKTVVENGRVVGYFVYYGSQYYSKENKIVVGGVIVGGKIFAVNYEESNGTYIFEIGDAKTGNRYIHKVITEEEAVETMGKILKVLSYNGIPF